MADPWEIVQYDVKAFPFARIVRQMIGVRDLTCLPKASAVATRESDQQTAYHSKFYQNLEAFLPTYRRLLCHLFDEGLDRVYFQRVPTFRVHMRGSVAVGAWHRDRDYGHDSSEVNYWLPLTPASRSNTIWIEGCPVTAKYGDIVVFDGANLEHGNTINRTTTSRVSFDFRIISKQTYRPRLDRSVSAGARFLVGEYWDLR